MRGQLSSAANRIEAFLAHSGSDRGPWLAVSFAAGIAMWIVLGTPLDWVVTGTAGVVFALGVMVAWAGREDRVHLRLACVMVGLVFAAGIAVIWARSAMVGTEPIARPVIETIDARVLERIEQPAEGRVRLVLAVREAESGRAIKVRVNLPLDKDMPALGKGALVRLRARLVPPAPPMLPGGYDFARAAWFDGLAATGSVLGDVRVLEPPPAGGGLSQVQHRLSAHVRAQLGGSPGAIAAALASGDRGAIRQSDEDAMRDAGLTHLLSISGLHASAVIATVYLVSIRLLALWPWLALRVRLPIVAAALAAGAGIGYTLLTGAQVPTIRSCIGAVLVLIALAMGREPLSLRLVAIAAFVVLLLWPESIAGPSFQMSFAAVIAIVALHSSVPARAVLAPHMVGWPALAVRRVAMLLLTGLLIELALMPIVLFHFHRAGIYGAFANVIAIPLTTFVSMPLIALALLLDIVGLGAPAWWLAGKSLEALLALAHFTASQPGAVKLMPQMGGWTLALFVAGGLWLGLWRGKVRMLGLVPVAAAAAMLQATPVPDLLISGDGRQVAIPGRGVMTGGRLLVLRDARSEFTRENLLEMAGMEGGTLPLAQWKGAQCSPDFCSLALERGGRRWNVLMERSTVRVPERALAAACDLADIVVADRILPRSCHPRWLKADPLMLHQTGGLAIDLTKRRIATVAQSQGEHGWWRGREPR